MSDDRKLIKNTFYLYILTVAKMLFPILTLPYLTRVLSLDVYGVVAYVKAYSSYIQLLLDFGFILSATRVIVIIKEDKEKVSCVLGNTIIEKTILGFIGAIITLTILNSIELLKGNNIFVWLYFCACFVTIFIPDFLYRGLEQMEYVAIPFVVSKIFVIVMTFILVRGDQDILVIPILEIIGNSIAAMISLLCLKKINVSIRFSGIRQWVDDLRISSIYFFSNFATTFLGAMTTIIVGIYLKKSDIAFWSICMQIVSAAKALYNPITNSLYPYMIQNKDIKLVRKVACVFFVPLSLGCGIVIFFGEQLLLLIGGDGYGNAGIILKYLLPVFVASFYSMLYGWPVLGAIGKEKETTISTVLAAVIQIGGIGILIISNNFELINLALCCDFAEVMLLFFRFVIFRRNRGY